MLGFLFRQLKQRNIYLLLLATACMTLMFAWKGVIKNEMFWDVNNK